jgi:hypothetical protein
VPGARTVAVAIGVGLVAAIYVELWIHWPTFLAVALGAVMAILLLMVASSLGEDPARADAAWRDAAPDLVAAQPPLPESQPGGDSKPSDPR